MSLRRQKNRGETRDQRSAAKIRSIYQIRDDSDSSSKKIGNFVDRRFSQSPLIIPQRTARIHTFRRFYWKKFGFFYDRKGNTEIRRDKDKERKREENVGSLEEHRSIVKMHLKRFVSVSRYFSNFPIFIARTFYVIGTSFSLLLLCYLGTTVKNVNMVSLVRLFR